MSSLERFHEEMGTLDGPMIVVTAGVGSERAGCLVGFHTQVSIEPPRYVVCLSVNNHTFRTATRATHLGVHFLSQDQLALAERFGTMCGARTDKFDGLELIDGPGDVPVLAECAHWFVGAILGTLPIDDHVAFSLKPITSGGTPERSGRLLGFQSVKHLEAGHEP